MRELADTDEPGFGTNSCQAVACRHLQAMGGFRVFRFGVILSFLECSDEVSSEWLGSEMSPSHTVCSCPQRG